jgi:flavodoxin
MKSKKILVTYYSRTGNTKKVAEGIAKELNAKIDQVIDLKDRKRFIIGWIISGKDSSLKKLTEIKTRENSEKFDLVVIGTPVWAWTVCPAIRTYITKNKFKRVAFFCTNGGQEGNTFKEMERLSKKPIATLSLLDKKIKKGEFYREIKSFCGRLK